MNEADIRAKAKEFSDEMFAATERLHKREPRLSFDKCFATVITGVLATLVIAAGVDPKKLFEHIK